MKKPKQFSTRINNSKKFVPRDRLQKQDLYKTKEWTAYRFRFLHHNPQCYCCPEKSQVVDHIVAHRGDKQLFEKNDNHLPLCKLCHDTITGLFDRKDSPDTISKLKWIKEKRELHNLKFKVKVVPYIKY